MIYKYPENELKYTRGDKGGKANSIHDHSKKRKQVKNNEELFLQANQQYDAGNYAQAIEIYESIAPHGRGVDYNLGNCWYQQGEYAQAIACWLRAQRGASRNEQASIAHNIACAYSLQNYTLYFVLHN